MSDQWRTCRRHLNYEVSRSGRVRNRTTGHILAGHPNNMGYLRVDLGGRLYFIHHLVAEEFIGPRPPGLKVLHGPNGRTDNSVGNLRYGTQAENVQQSVQEGTHYFTARALTKRDNCGTV